MKRGRPKGSKKVFLIENEYGGIEDMSSKFKPLTSFNVYRKREDKTRRNARVFYRSAYTIGKPMRLLDELKPKNRKQTKLNN